MDENTKLKKISRPTILLIEDDDEDIELVHNMLGEFRNQRYYVHTCGSITECIETVDMNEIDIILLDLGLPESNGLDTFDTMNRMYPGKPIVVLTGLWDDEVGNRAVKHGAQDYLVKGEVNARLLERVLAYSIQRKRSSEHLIALNGLKERLLTIRSLQDMLSLITDWTVAALDANFARIWIIQKGDLCEKGCIHAAATEGPHFCRYRNKCLRLMASSGRYTHLDGEVHKRVPFGCYKIGKIASGDIQKFVTNDVVNDPRVHNHEWAAELGLRSFAGYQLSSQQGDPIGVLAVFSKNEITHEEDLLLNSVANTTAQVIMTSEYHEKLLHQADLLRNVSDAIISTDLDFHVLSWNRGAELMYGWEAGEVLGKHFGDLVRPNYPDRDPEDVKRTFFETGKFKGIVSHNRKSGEAFSIMGHVTMIRDHEGKPAGAVAINRDITEQLASRVKLNVLNKKLEDKNNELSEIIHITSHDLRSPMVNIDGFSREIRDQVDTISRIIEGSSMSSEEKIELKNIIDEEIREGLTYIGSSIRTIDGLINGLLRIARLGTALLDVEELDMTAMIRTIIPNFEFRLKECDAKLITDDLPPCSGDRTQINQVFSNLLDNAIKYQDNERPLKITVSGRTDGDYSIYSIADNGIGIPETQLDRIFSIFHRVNSIEIAGEGLGLSAVRRILDRNDGIIQVSSKVGTGTTFEVSLPTIGTMIPELSQPVAHSGDGGVRK